MALANPYVMFDLKLPDDSRARTKEWIAGGPGGAVTAEAPDGPDGAPFRRNLDLWWLAMCLGLQANSRVSKPSTAFFKGSILEPWRIQQLQLIGVALLGSESISTPGDVIVVANEFAASGIDRLEAGIAEGGQKVLWVASELLNAQTSGASA